MAKISKLSILLLLLLLPISCYSTNCIERDCGEGSIVCVCNSTHCDEISLHSSRSGYVTVYTSTKSGLRFHGETQPIGQLRNKTPSGDENGPTNWTERRQCHIVNGPSKFKQTVLGFGGSFTDATGININQLSSETKENLMKSYFSPTGIQYTLCRVPIGSTDFSTRFYTYHDNESSSFSLTDDDLQDKIPLIRMANEMSNLPVRLMASPWGAPKWMRLDDGDGALKVDAYQLWADYFIKFFEEYEKYNVSFWGVTAQNEPFFANYLKFILPSIDNFMEYNIRQMNTFVNEYFGPTIKSSQFSNLKIMAFDDNTVSLPIYLKDLMENSSSNNSVGYVDGIAFHWYLNQHINYTSVLSDTHWKYPEKFLLSTEACTGVVESPDVLLGSWERGERYAHDIMKVLQNWGSGWIDWNMALDCDGAPNWINNFVDSPIIVNATEDAFYKQPMFYALGHFSKFIPPGSKIVNFHCECPDEDVELVVASVPQTDQNNHTVAVVLNRSEVPKLMDLKDTDTEVVIQMKIPPRSIQTYIWTTE
ncbi:hypothetical protein CHUAL_005502 [Chamberlinius hualienensis]